MLNDNEIPIAKNIDNRIVVYPQLININTILQHNTIEIPLQEYYQESNNEQQPQTFEEHHRLQQYSLENYNEINNQVNNRKKCYCIISLITAILIIAVVTTLSAIVYW